jgi:hypothetical protein
MGAEGLRDLRVWPTGPLFALVGLQEHLGVPDLVARHSTLLDPSFQLLPLFTCQFHHILLHKRSPYRQAFLFLIGKKI